MARCSRSDAELPEDIALSPWALLMVFATDQAFQSALNGKAVLIGGGGGGGGGTLIISNKATIPQALWTICADSLRLSSSHLTLFKL